MYVLAINGRVPATREYFEDHYVMDASGVPRSYTAAW